MTSRKGRASLNVVQDTVGPSYAVHNVQHTTSPPLGTTVIPPIPALSTAQLTMFAAPVASTASISMVAAPPLSDQQGPPTPYLPTRELPPLALYKPEVSIDERICRGHPGCIQFALTSWAQSAYPQTDWEECESAPATVPELPAVVLRFPLSALQLEVRASRFTYVTVVDVLECLYDARHQFPKARFIGLSPMSFHFLRVHLDD